MTVTERTAGDSTPADARVSRETTPFSAADPDVRGFFGTSIDAIAGFHDLLVAEGELRGLIGPRELDRLWDRHLLNSAAVVQYLPQSGTIVDLGSGAGLPGIVIAAMLPDTEVVLIEPMERRCVWLSEVADRLGLGNVEVRRGRAEEFEGAVEADALTARAVAPLDRLARWSFPLVRRGGELVLLKGRNAEAEVPAAQKVLRKYAATDPELFEARTIDRVEPTMVLRTVRTR